MFYPVILAGGSGERFWPLSRQNKPKQFLTLDGSGRSLLQATADRLNLTSGEPERLLIVTANDHRAQMFEQLPELPLENLLVEPVARDTAAAVLYAALTVQREEAGAVMGIFPADHRVTDQPAFQEAVQQAVQYARTHDRLVTLGMQPTYPATGYGYIERGERDESAEGGGPVHYVRCFTEKPDVETAQVFVNSGRYLWNSGMFVWRVQTILQAFEEFTPELYGLMSRAIRTRGELRKIYAQLPKISVDYAILERARNVSVLPAAFGWDDLRDWNALERLLKGDGQNVVVGRHVGLGTDRAILYATDGEGLIATIGLDEVVRAGDVTLVVRKDRT